MALITDYQPTPGIADGSVYVLPQGVTRGVPAELYHADPNSVSKSTLYEMRISAAHCHHRMNHPKPPTDDMMFCTVVDHLMYSPDDPPPFVISPHEKFQTKEAKAWKAAQTLPIISEADFRPFGRVSHGDFQVVGEADTTPFATLCGLGAPGRKVQFAYPAVQLFPAGKGVVKFTAVLHGLPVGQLQRPFFLALLGQLIEGAALAARNR